MGIDVTGAVGVGPDVQAQRHRSTLHGDIRGRLGRRVHRVTVEAEDVVVQPLDRWLVIEPRPGSAADDQVRQGRDGSAHGPGHAHDRAGGSAKSSKDSETVIDTVQPTQDGLFTPKLRCEGTVPAAAAAPTLAPTSSSEVAKRTATRLSRPMAAPWSLRASTFLA